MSVIVTVVLMTVLGRREFRFGKVFDIGYNIQEA